MHIDDIITESELVRLDNRRIRDFGKELRKYHHATDWSTSGTYPADQDAPSDWQSIHGLFAGDRHDTAPYAAPRGIEFVTLLDPFDSQPTVVFKRGDRDKIRNHRPVLSIFDRDSFKQLPSGEWFSEDPPAPMKQTIISNPLRYIQQQGWRVAYTDDMQDFIDRLDKAGREYGAERVTESGAAARLAAQALEDYANANISPEQEAFGDFMYHAELLRQGHPDVHAEDLTKLPADVAAKIQDVVAANTSGRQPVLEAKMRKAKTLIDGMIKTLMSKGRTRDEAIADLKKQIDGRFYETVEAYTSGDIIEENLRDWFKQKWVRFGPDGKIRGSCARGSSGEGKPKCLPQKKAHALGKKGRASAARRKRREDPNPERHGKAKNVRTKEGVAEGSEQQYLWHGSRQKILMLEPRQSVDTGGAAGSNQNAIYATSDPKVAIAMGLTTPGSDTGMFPNDPQMVLFNGKIRKGENVYLHKVPMNGPDGNPQFVQGGNSREFHSVPGVKGIKPTEIKAVPVDKYLNLIRQATPQDLELRKKYMKQGMAEDMTCPHCGGIMVSKDQLSEKKDACYYKVKSRYKVWPSAYASGALVQCRKKGAKNWGKGKAEESVVLEREAKDKITNAVIDFYRKHTKLTPPEDYEAAAQELIKAAEPSMRDKITHILQQAKSNPYLQGGFITTIGALLAGKVIGLAAQYGLSPYQTNLMLQAILNTVIPALVSKINGRDWKETVKYTLASAGVGTGIAALSGMNEGREDAVNDLMADLGNQKTRLAAADKPVRYADINAMMQRIAKANGITADQLHADWMERYHESPDDWVLDENHADSRDVVPAQQILDYVKDIHPEGEFNIDHVITDHPHWTQASVPMGKLHIFDPEADDVDDPYNRVQDTDLNHVRKLIPNIASIVQKRPIVIDDHGWVLDGNHRALAALKAGLTSIPAWMPAKGPIDENFADGKGPGRPGDSQRHGIPKGATMAQLQKAAKAPGRKGQLARWQINMRRGRKKANESLHKAHISFPDGDIYVSSHVWQRRRERDMDMATIAGLVFDAIRQHGEAISRLGAENFVVRDSAGNGIGIAKVLQPDDTYKYIIQTTHPNMRIGRDQTFFRIDEEEMTVDQWRELRKVDPKTYDGTKDWQTLKWWEGMYRMHEKKAREQGAKHFEFPPGSNMWFTVTKGPLFELPIIDMEEGDVVTTRFRTMQQAKGKTPFTFDKKIADTIPLYDPKTRKAVKRQLAKGDELEFQHFDVRRLGGNAAEIRGHAPDGAKVTVGIVPTANAYILADAFNRKGFTRVQLQPSDDVNEAQGKGALTIFDIDDTLFKTTAKINVMRDGEIIKRLSGDEYQTNQLQPGETYDYTEFRDARRFHDTSIPISNMWQRANDTIGAIGKRADSKVIIITARPDLDDKSLFLDTFEKHGMDVSKVHIHRAGNLPVPAADAKRAIIAKYLDSGRFESVRFFDDSRTNLDAFLQLKSDYPGIRFEAYLVLPRGDIAQYTS